MENSILVEITRQHFQAVIEKRLDVILKSYLRSESLLVFVEGPRWATLGYERVKQGWSDFVDSDIAVRQCKWTKHLRSEVGGEMGFVAGVVEMQAEIRGEVKTIEFRGTFVFVKDSDGEWRIAHEHFSQPAADPYGIGDWLISER